MRHRLPARGALACVGVALSTLSWGGCRQHVEPTVDARSFAADAEEYVDVVLALGERDHDSIDFYSGPPEPRARARERNLTMPEIRRWAVELRERLASGPSASADEQSRREFMIRQLDAVIGRIDLLAGKRFTFDEESRLFFGVTVDEGDRTSADRARAELERLLPGRGSLGQRYAAFDSRFMVPPDRLPAVIARALEECRRVTLEHMSLPAGESVSVEYTRMMPWSAFTTYEGRGHSRIEINTDFGLTVDRAFNLACHEAYPGHHAINTLIDTRLVGPSQRVELMTQPMFSPQTLRTEGAATFAPELAFTDANRLVFGRDELFPLAGLKPHEAERYYRVSKLVGQLGWFQADVARRYLDGDLEFVRAAAELEDRALMSSPEATLKFLNEFRTYAVTYTVGRDLVAREVDGQGEADEATRWRSFERWVTNTK